MAELERPRCGRPAASTMVWVGTEEKKRICAFHTAEANALLVYLAMIGIDTPTVAILMQAEEGETCEWKLLPIEAGLRDRR